MKVVSVDDLTVPAGQLQILVPTASSAESSPTPPSFNQRNHVAAATISGGWLATTFELNTGIGGPDMPALEEAFVSLVKRHGTLKTSFVADPEVKRIVHKEPFTWHTESFTLVDDGAQRQARFRRIVDSFTRPYSFPGYMLGVIRTADNATVVAAFNHIHVDAMSLAVAVRDLLAAYRGEVLEPVSSFVDYCAQPRFARPADARGIAEWHRFLDAHEGGLPRFPGELGVVPGERVPQRVIVRQLLDGDETAAAEQAALEAGGRMSAGVLAACAAAAAVLPTRPAWFARTQLAPAPPLATLIAASTRRDPRWAGSLGWFVTNVPIEIPTTGETLADGIAATQIALDAALQLSEVPLGAVAASYPGQLHLERDVFMISYLDYRRVAGAEERMAHNAHHVSGNTPADDVQVWFSRTDRGVAVRVRMPDTAAAAIAVETWLAGVEDGLLGLGDLSRATGAVAAWR
jgi:hypothetical protein